MFIHGPPAFNVTPGWVGRDETDLSSSLQFMSSLLLITNSFAIVRVLSWGSAHPDIENGILPIEWEDSVLIIYNL